MPSDHPKQQELHAQPHSRDESSDKARPTPGSSSGYAPSANDAGQYGKETSWLAQYSKESAQVKLCPKGHRLDQDVYGDQVYCPHCRQRYWGDELSPEDRLQLDSKSISNSYPIVNANAPAWDFGSSHNLTQSDVQIFQENGMVSSYEASKQEYVSSPSEDASVRQVGAVYRGRRSQDGVRESAGEVWDMRSGDDGELSARSHHPDQGERSPRVQEHQSGASRVSSRKVEQRDVQVADGETNTQDAGRVRDKVSERSLSEQARTRSSVVDSPNEMGKDNQDDNGEQYAKRKAKHEGQRRVVAGVHAAEASRSAATAAAPQVYYHVAPAHARESIAQHGLDSTRGEKAWPNAEYPQANYLFSDWDSAYGQALTHQMPIEDMPYSSEDEDDWDTDWLNHDVDVYKVNANGLDVQPDPLHPHGHMVNTPIPPQHLELIPDWQDYDLEPPDYTASSRPEANASSSSSPWELEQVGSSSDHRPTHHQPYRSIPVEQRDGESEQGHHQAHDYSNHTGEDNTPQCKCDILSSDICPVHCSWVKDAPDPEAAAKELEENPPHKSRYLTIDEALEAGKGHALYGEAEMQDMADTLTPDSPDFPTANTVDFPIMPPEQPLPSHARIGHIAYTPDWYPKVGADPYDPYDSKPLPMDPTLEFPNPPCPVCNSDDVTTISPNYYRCDNREEHHGVSYTFSPPVGKYTPLVQSPPNIQCRECGTQPNDIGSQAFFCQQCGTRNQLTPMQREMVRAWKGSAIAHMGNSQYTTTTKEGTHGTRERTSIHHLGTTHHLHSQEDMTDASPSVHSDRDYVQKAEDLLGVPIDIAIGVPHGSFHRPQREGSAAYTESKGSLSDGTDGGGSLRESAMTLPQQQRAWNQLAGYGFHEPQHSEEVHTFPDGWSIRKLNSDEAASWVGQSMKNCWQGYDEGGFAYDTGVGKVPHSLHDQHGIPRTAFFVQDGHPYPYIWSVYGPRNAPINERIYNRLDEFAHHNNYTIDPAKSFLFHPENQYRQIMEQNTNPDLNLMKEGHDEIDNPRFRGGASRNGANQSNNGANSKLDYHLSKGGIFYHVAPSHLREKIQQEGLKGEAEVGESPWGQMRQEWQHLGDQPSGVYLWDTPENARAYAYAVHGAKDRDNPYPGDKMDEEWEDRYIYDEDLDEYSENPDWFEKGYDVWKVNAQGLPVQNDPERSLTDGELSPEEAQQQINHEVKEYGGPETSEGWRWYVPSEHPVGPERIELHHTIPYGDMTENDFYDTLENARQVPNAWERVPIDQWNENARQRYLAKFVSWLPKI